MTRDGATHAIAWGVTAIGIGSTVLLGSFSFFLFVWFGLFLYLAFNFADLLSKKYNSDWPVHVNFISRFYLLISLPVILSFLSTTGSK